MEHLSNYINIIFNLFLLNFFSTSSIAFSYSQRAYLILSIQGVKIRIHFIKNIYFAGFDVALSASVKFEVKRCDGYCNQSAFTKVDKKIFTC